MTEAKFMQDRVAEAIARAALAGEDFGGQARAAIAAMREPTEAMVNNEQLPYSPGEMLGYWQAMIDEALK